MDTPPTMLFFCFLETVFCVQITTPFLHTHVYVKNKSEGGVSMEIIDMCNIKKMQKYINEKK